MPWKVQKRGSRYCVIKETDGSNEGCHDTREEAEAHQRALYAHEPKMATDPAGGYLIDGEPPTSAMVALIPSEADLARLAVPGGEPAAAMHLTLVFLGEAAAWSAEQQSGVLAAVGGCASESGPIEGEAFAAALFNPGPDQAFVLMVGEGKDQESGHSPIVQCHDQVISNFGETEIPAQHSPWVAHVTLGYGETIDFGEVVDRIGPITFDRIRVAFGEAVTDIPLSGGQGMDMPMPDDMKKPDDMEMSGRPWSGPIAFEDQMTGDGRIFSGGSINWLTESLPWPFRWAREDHGGHDGAITIGRVDNLYRDPSSPGVIFANGIVLTGESSPPEAAEYINLLENGAAGGVSVDGDSAEFNIVEVAGPDGTITGLEQHFTAMRLRTLTAVDIPAFIGARIALADMETVAASACDCADDNGHFTSVEFASTKPWNGSTGNFSDEQYRRSAAGCDSGDGPVKQRCFLPHHDPGGALNVNGLHAAAQRAGQLKGRSPEAVSRAKAHLRRHYGEVGEEAPDSLGAAADDVVVAAAIPTTPPLGWFTEPAFDGPTPITVTADGRVYGHLATWGTCHIAMPQTCVTPPRGSTYAYFHTGEVLTASGDPVAVGHLTFGTGHADMAASGAAAAAHYDNTATVAADVRAGEDRHGIWVAGALRPGLTDEQIREFRAAPLSGDWRRIGGRLELVAALAVNTPGFPVPRTRARVLVASGHEQTIVAAMAIEVEERKKERRLAKTRLAAGVRKTGLVQRVGGR